MTEKTLSRQFIEMRKDYKNKRRQKQKELKQLGKEFEENKKALIKKAKNIKRAKDETQMIKQSLQESLDDRIEDERELVRQSIAKQFSTYTGECDD